jgi:hypothetical protein
LTAKQRKDFNDLMGKPFDLERLRNSDGKRPPSLTFIFGLGGANSYVLLGDASVRRELQLSEAQSETIKRLLQQGDKDLTAVRLDVLKNAGRDFSEMELAEKRRTVRAILARVAPIYQKKTSEILQVLSGEQAAKLDRKLVQLVGARSLDSERVAAGLQLTAEQRSAIARLNAQFVDVMAPLVVVRERSDFDQATYDKNLEKLEAAERSILSIEQKKTLEKLATE